MAETIDVVPNIAFSLYSSLPKSCQVPRGFQVGYKKVKGSSEIFEDAEAFFKVHATEWSDITSFKLLSREGSVMSKFINGIVAKGIEMKTITNRCVTVNINDNLYFGLLNSLLNPYYAVDEVPAPITNSISYVILISHGNINRKMPELIDNFAKYLKTTVAELYLTLKFYC
jgi:hypothetical protein